MKASEKLLIEEHLKNLHLSHVLKNYVATARQAHEAGDSYESFLLTLLEQEIQLRQAQQLQRRLKEARFPQMKTLEETDLNKWPRLEAMQVKEYAQADYISRRENLVFLGKHGSGKTHAAIAFGIEACRRGFRVAFFTAANLVNTLVEAQDERQLKRFLNKLQKIELLILDELGYLPLSQKGAQLLFQVFSERYEQKSMIVTSNLPFAQWNTVFAGDVNMTAALLDRLTHHCEVHQFDWTSLRLEESLKRHKNTKDT